LSLILEKLPKKTLFIEVSVALYQARKVSDRVFVFGTSILPLVKTFLLDFGTVSTV